VEGPAAYAYAANYPVIEKTFIDTTPSCYNKSMKRYSMATRELKKNLYRNTVKYHKPLARKFKLCLQSVR